MADGRAYDGAVTPVTGHFTKEQRARLEALTFARKLVGTGAGTTIGEWIRVADYIIKGD